MTVPDIRSARRSREGFVTVAGVAGGVGVTTVATALDAGDRGVFVGRAVDVLVCRASGDSLVRAGYAAQLVMAWSGIRPIVAVTSASASGQSRPVTARLRLLEPHTSGVVVLPFVRRWRELAAPLDEVQSLLTRSARDLPRGVRPYAAALHQLRAVIDDRSPAAARPSPGRAAPTCTAASAARDAIAVRSL